MRTSIFNIIVFIATFLTALTFTSKLSAQEMTEDKFLTKQLWIDYNASININDDFRFYGGLGARTLYPKEWNRFVFTPSVMYSGKKILLNDVHYREELHSGIGIYYTDNLNSQDRLEIRLFQGYKFSWPTRPYIQFQHYFRIDERFDMETANWVTTFGFRLKYEINMLLRFKKDSFFFNDKTYLPVSVELFWNLKDAQQFNDVLRVTPGFGYEYSSAWKAQLEVTYHYTRNTIEDNFATSDFVFRIRVFHNLD